MSSRLPQAAWVALAATVVTLGAAHFGALDGLEDVAWDARVRRLSAAETASDRIKLVLLDQDSLDFALKNYQLPWPWPREPYGVMADFCRRAGVRTLVMDVLFTEPSYKGVYDDESLRDALARLPSHVCAVVLSDKSGDLTAWPDGWPGRTLAIEGLDDWMGAGGGRRTAASFATLPIPEVSDSAAYAGNVAAAAVNGSVQRRAGLFRLFDGRPVPSLGLAAFLAAYPDTRLRIEKGWFWLNDRRIPIDDDARVILRYRGPYDAHETVNVESVLESELRLNEGQDTVLELERFRDAIVLFGFSAPALLDLRPTPISPVAPGVSVHATLLDNLIRGDPIREAPASAVALGTLGLSFLGALAVRRMRGAKAAAAVFALLLPVPALAGLGGYLAGFWLPVASGTVALGLAMVGALAVSYALEGRERAYLKAAFQHYLSPAVIEQLLEDPGRLELGGERREVSMMFSDLEGFSSIAEQMDASSLTALLNEYLSDMTEIILDEEGTLDKYEGDAIIAFWNAPLDQPDHAARAVRAAMRCQERLAEKREVYRARGGHTLRMRVGLHTGAVAVGNMGSRERFDYTVLGDAANLAARLEGANKTFGTYTLVSQATREAAGDAFFARALGSLRVVGRAEPVEVFEPFAADGGAEGVDLEVFAEALARFREGDLVGALAGFERLRGDPASDAYAARCRAGPADPGGHWDPTWNLTSK